jgi:Fe-Mn family superoxide dismutase
MVKRYELPELGYEYSAMEPVISERIMELHHSKHHAGYVKKANAALEMLEKARTGDMGISHKAVMRDLTFNLNGHLMHSIFWKNLRTPQDNNMPSDKLQSLIADQFGSFEAFREEYSKAAKGVEGSGWAVLGTDHDQNLAVYQIEKHNLMHLAGFHPALVIDVWEHAYYLDYENNRGTYVDGFWKIVNWDDVEARIL